MTIHQLLPIDRILDSPEALEEIYEHPQAVHLRADFVASLDGAIAVGGRSKPLGGPADREAFMAMRAVADAVLVGAGTARDERYGAITLDEAVQRRRRARGQGDLPRLAIVSAHAGLDVNAKVFDGPDRPLLLTTDRAIAERHDLEPLAEMVSCGTAAVDLQAAVDALHQRNLGRICCEGGPTLFGDLLAAGLVDELCLTHSPLLAGSSRHLAGDETLDPPVALRLTHLMDGDGLLLARYTIR